MSGHSRAPRIRDRSRGGGNPSGRSAGNGRSRSTYQCAILLVRPTLGQIPGANLARPRRRRPRTSRVQRSSALCSMAGVLTRAARAPARSTTTSPNKPCRVRRLGLADLRFQCGRIVDAAMHGAQDGGLGGERKMLELALVRVIRVADAARSRQPLDERRQGVRGHAATPGSGTDPPSPVPQATGAGQHADRMRGVEHDFPAIAVAGRRQVELAFGFGGIEQQQPGRARTRCRRALRPGMRCSGLFHSWSAIS